MNKLNKKSIYPLLITACVPLLMLGGCAGNDTLKFDGDTSLADTQMNETVQAEPQINGHMNDLPADMGDQLELSYQAPADVPMTAESFESVEPVENNALVDISTENTVAKPQEKIIGFGFDQAEVNDHYAELLMQYAQYLRQNENLILYVNGHTDASGARLYNEMLSKKRAQQVADILIENGAPQDRVKIDGSADDLPLVGAVHHREHRRVELDYQDQQIVSN